MPIQEKLEQGRPFRVLTTQNRQDVVKVRGPRIFRKIIPRLFHRNQKLFLKMLAESC